MIAILFFVGIFVGLGFYAWKDRAKLKAEEQAAAQALDGWRLVIPVPPEQLTKVEPKP